MSQLYGCPDVAFQRTGLSEVSRTCLGAEEGLPWALTAAQDSVQAVFLGQLTFPGHPELGCSSQPDFGG